MRSTSADGGPRRGWLGAVIATSVGIVALGTGLSFAAQNQSQSDQQKKTCDATFVAGGGTTATGEVSDPKSLTAGSSVFPMGSMVKVTNPATNKSVTVRINDKNSFCVAMQPAAFKQVRTPGKNLIRAAQVEVIASVDPVACAKAINLESAKAKKNGNANGKAGGNKADNGMAGGDAKKGNGNNEGGNNEGGKDDADNGDVALDPCNPCNVVADPSASADPGASADPSAGNGYGKGQDDAKANKDKKNKKDKKKGKPQKCDAQASQSPTPAASESAKAAGGNAKAQSCVATFVNGGGTTASGEVSDPTSLTAGSSQFPIGTLVKVTNPETNKSVTVRINDKNSFCVAMQVAAFEKIRTPGKNLIRDAQVQVVGRAKQ